MSLFDNSLFFHVDLFGVGGEHRVELYESVAQNFRFSLPPKIRWDHFQPFSFFKLARSSPLAFQPTSRLQPQSELPQQVAYRNDSSSKSSGAQQVTRCYLRHGRSEVDTGLLLSAWMAYQLGSKVMEHVPSKLQMEFECRLSTLHTKEEI